MTSSLSLLKRSAGTVTWLKRSILPLCTTCQFSSPEITRLNLIASRRLQLAAEETGLTALLPRQKPGSAKGATFMAIEDETDLANLVIWPSLFEQQRRFIYLKGCLPAGDEFKNRED